MTRFMRRKMPVVVVGAITLAAASAVYAEQPMQADLSAKVAELEAKVSSLEGANSQRVKDTQATIDAVLSDADQHSKLMASGMAGAGRDEKGFYIAGNGFEIRPMIGLQFENITNFGQNRKNGENDIENGFQLTRTRFGLSGFIADPHLSYMFQWGSDINGGMTLLDAVVMYNFADAWTFKVGQFKDLATTEGLVDWNKQLASQRSLVNQLLGTPDGVSGRVQGAGLIYGTDTDKYRVEAAFHDGVGSANTSFQDNGATHWGASARADFMINGNWKDRMDLTARTLSEDLFAVGVGGDITEGDNILVYKLSADVQYEMKSGLTLYAALLGAIADQRNVGNDGSTFNWGGLVQAGYNLSEELQVFGRLDLTKFEDDVTVASGDTEDTFYEITAGVNYFLGKNGGANNNAKITLDVTWLPNGAPGAQAYQSILGGSTDNEVVVHGSFVLAL